MSDRSDERTHIETYLEQVGLGVLAGGLKVARNRERSRVWSSRLYTPGGDATIEIIAYGLHDDPGLVVEYEEERATLEAFAAQEPRWPRVPELLLAERTSDAGLLVTTPEPDAPVVRRYLGAWSQRGNEAAADHPDWLTYHPQLDRLLGGDFVREMNGHPVKSCLMSRERAERLVLAMQALQRAYAATMSDAATEREPFPVMLAVLELSSYPIKENGQYRDASIDEMMTLDAFAGAPDEYRHLAQMHAVVPGIGTLRSQPPLGERQAVFAGARQLLQIVGIGHRLPATFSRADGCCLRPEFVTPAGQLTDLYFLSGPDEGLNEAELQDLQRRDLLNAFEVVLILIGSLELVEDSLRAGVAAYLSPLDTPTDLVDLIVETARRVAALSDQSPAVWSALSILAMSCLAVLTRARMESGGTTT